MRTLQQIEARMAEIRGLLEAPDADLAALEAEITELTEERTALEAAVEKRAALVKAVATGNHKVIRAFPAVAGAADEPESFDASSPEYRSAFLKKLAKNPTTGEMRLGDLTEVEERAFTYTTATTTAVLPTQMSTKIWDLIEQRYALLGHVAKSAFKNIYQFDQATVIVSGDAAETAQNTANSEDLQITMVPITISGVEHRADVLISRKMQIQSMDGFEDFLVRKIGSRIGAKMNAGLFTDLVDDRLVANLIETAGALSEADFRAALGAVKGGFDCRVYANQSTIWNDIAGVQDDVGRPYFVASTVTDDPTLQGHIFGKKVYLDDTIADDTIHVLYVDTVEANLFQDVEILSDVDAKTHATTHGGLAIFEGALGDTRGLATISITAAVS
jgi:HK97 family phage major capsid protein